MPVPKGYVFEHRRPVKPIGSTLLGDRIKQERFRMGFKLYEFARLTGIDQSTLSRVENAGMVPGWERMIRIAQVLDCSLDWLAGLED